MITFRDVKETLDFFEGTFWIVGESKKEALLMTRKGISKAELSDADFEILLPLSFDIVLERLKYYNITPPELIEQAEQL